jgi:hypothetical protein
LKVPAVWNVYEKVALVSSPGEWNDPSLATTVWGSPSWLVQVTVAPTGTVSVAGTNAKLSIPTAGPPVGAAGPELDADAFGGAADEGPVPWPGIPGVALACEPKVIDGGACGAGLDPEQPETSRMPAAAKATNGSVASER